MRTGAFGNCYCEETGTEPVTEWRERLAAKAYGKKKAAAAQPLSPLPASPLAAGQPTAAPQTVAASAAAHKEEGGERGSEKDC